MVDIVAIAHDGNLAELRQALDAGADINEVNSVGDTALLWAAWAGNAEVVRLLVERGADRTIRNRNGSLTALELAIRAQHPEVVAILEAADRLPAAPTEKWEKMGASAVAHVGNYPNLDKKITTVFNFASRERYIISESLKAKTQAIGTPVSFDVLAQETVTQALDEFTKLGGKADRDYVLGQQAPLDKPKARLKLEN